MESLIEKAKDGDQIAFTELMLQIKDELYKVAKIRLKNDDDVFDVIQETMISAYKSLKKLKHNEYFKTYMPIDRKSTRLNSSHVKRPRMPSSA